MGADSVTTRIKVQRRSIAMTALPCSERQRIDLGVVPAHRAESGSVGSTRRLRRAADRQLQLDEDVDRACQRSIFSLVDDCRQREPRSCGDRKIPLRALSTFSGERAPAVLERTTILRRGAKRLNDFATLGCRSETAWRRGRLATVGYGPAGSTEASISVHAGCK